MPKSVQPKAKERIHDIYMVPTEGQTLVAYNAFLSLYGTKFGKACECLMKDKGVLLSFYDFPAEHCVINGVICLIIREIKCPLI